MNQTPLLVIVGPTASGKTDVAIALAKLLGGEVVSADSVQVYQHLDIGSAKPTLEERQGIPHHMLDVVAPDAPYSAADFQRQARQCVADIAARGRVPILAGGSGLYVGAVTDDLDFTATRPDEALRAECAAFAQAHGNEALHARLRQVAPLRAAQLHPNDRVRVIRALEQCAAGDAPPRQFCRRPYYTRVLWWGLTCPREELYHRIDLRAQLMMRAGFLQEVQKLRAMGYASTLVSMQSLGYRQLCEHLDGFVELPEAVENMQRQTRRFAKRQLTWFYRNDKIHWMEASLSANLLAQEMAQLWSDFSSRA